MIRASRWVACAVVLLACTPKDTPQASSTAPLATGSAPAPPLTPSSTARGPIAPPFQAEPLLVVTEPSALAELEKSGLALGDFLIGPDTGAVSNRRLLESPRYASVVATLKADVRGLAAGDPAAGVGVARYSHRLFDVRWLEAEALRFELVAAVNRADRAAFRPGSCGETRLVYRLGYPGAAGGPGSRLPMTLSLEIPIAGPRGCGDAVDRWRLRASLSGAELARALTAPGAALERSFLDHGFAAARLAANVQGVRWPSAVRPDLGGHAEYLLRSFELDAQGRYQPALLENTPDTARLERDPALRADFVTWLRAAENLSAVARGVALIPERFLADRALSVTPRGLSRLANRPFSGVLTAPELGELRFPETGQVRSAAGLLRRLDALSCPGCHAARSVAGFHLLGDDAVDGTPGNSLSSGLSPHVRDDLARRLAFAQRAGEPGNDDSQPFPERGAYAGYGAHCGLGGDPSFAGWGCASGLVCKPYDGPAGDGVGQCVPESGGLAGDACEIGPLQAKRNARRDRVARVERSACAGTAVCDTNAVGFPGGMCAESCSALSPSAACGAIAILDPFNACLARNEPFSTCLSQHVRPAGLRACGPEAPCRDDYVCARGPNADVCLPPYFLFQLRVDGHR
jgi:hypothetical protein